MFSHFALEESVRGQDVKIATVRATQRAKSYLGSFLAGSGSVREFEERLASARDIFDDCVKSACDDEACTDRDRVAHNVENHLRVMADVPPLPEAGPEVAPLPDPGTVVEMMKQHQHASPEEQEQLMRFYQMTNGAEPVQPDQQVNDPNHYDDTYDRQSKAQGMRDLYPHEWRTADGNPFAKKDDDDKSDKKDDSKDDDDDKSKGHKSKPCPTCKAKPGEDCKKLTLEDDVSEGKTHDARKKGEGEGAVPIMKLMHQFVAAWPNDPIEAVPSVCQACGGVPIVQPGTDQNTANQAWMQHAQTPEHTQNVNRRAQPHAQRPIDSIFSANEDSADHYVQETVDLDSESNLDLQEVEPSMKTNTSPVKGEGLPRIEVPSKEHPSEDQSVLQVRDDTKEQVIKRPELDDTINVTEPIGSGEAGPNTQVFPSGNGAEAVTAKWAVL